MTVTFRFAQPAELPQAGRLAAHSFPGANRNATWWYEHLRDPPYGGGAGTLWTGVQDGQLVAACQLHSLHQWVAGKPLPVMGLGTVAIAPTHRRRGLAGRLVASALRAARERGDLASALYPFRAAFYARLGYGLAGEALQYLVPPESLRDSEERGRVELAETEVARAEVQAFYAAWVRGQTGQMERPERVWQHALSAPERALVTYRGQSGAVEGYALVAYRTDLPPQERYLEVDELAWSTSAARLGLHAWLGSLGDQWRLLLLRALPSHRLGDWLVEPRLPWGRAPGWGLWFPSATLLLGPMFRLLDVQGAWAQRAVREETALTLGLVVQDEQLEENAGEWRLRLERGRVEVQRGAGAADVELRLDVGTLSRLFVGALSASAAVEAGLAACDRADRIPELDHALRLPEPWTFDRF